MLRWEKMYLWQGTHISIIKCGFFGPSIKLHPLINQHLSGGPPRSFAASTAALTTASKICGSCDGLFQDVMAAKPAQFISASQFSFKIADLMPALSVPKPSMTAESWGVTEAGIFDAVRT
jgi:hypothetical protein